jgi:hypothetical protein
MTITLCIVFIYRKSLLIGTYIVNGHHGHLYSFIIENFMILKFVIDLTQLNFHVKIHATEKIK